MGLQFMGLCVKLMIGGLCHAPNIIIRRINGMARKKVGVVVEAEVVDGKVVESNKGKEEKVKSKEKVKANVPSVNENGNDKAVAHYEGNVKVSGQGGVKNAMSKETAIIITRIQKNLSSMGNTAKAVCKDMAKVVDKETKFLVQKLGVSKATVSQMRKAGLIYNTIPKLEVISHTNVVELAPLFKGLESNVKADEWRAIIDNFTYSVFGEENSSKSDFDVALGGDTRIEKLAGLTQRKLREAVNDYLGDNAVANVKGDEIGDGEKADVNEAVRSIKEVDSPSFKELLKMLDKYHVTKADKEKVVSLVETIVNDVINA